MNKTFKIILLVILWIIFSPLFIVMAKYWKMMKLKYSIPLSLLSPVGLILLASMALFIYLEFDEYYRTHHYLDRDVIKTMTGLELPDFDVVEYKEGRRAITGDFCDNVIISFEDEIPSSTFVVLDSLVRVDEHWSSCDSVFKYNIIWGNGYPAPSGENDEHDGFFSLEMKKGSREAEIEYGMW